MKNKQCEVGAALEGNWQRTKEASADTNANANAAAGARTLLSLFSSCLG